MITIIIAVPSAKTLKSGTHVTRDVKRHMFTTVTYIRHTCRVEWIENVEFSYAQGFYWCSFYGDKRKLVTSERFNKLNDVKEFLNHVLNRKERFDIV